MAKNYFSEWLESLPNSEQKVLPLTHVTKFENARRVIDKGELEPQHCDVLGGDYVFTFYGRSAYRVKVDGTVTSESLSPICLIFDCELERGPKKRFPFDSGAFGNGFYSSALQSDAKIDDFEIIGGDTLPNRLISAFFDSSEKYIDGDSSGIRPADKICKVDDSEARAFHELASGLGTNRADDRLHTIEFCFDRPLKLKGKLKGVIVPSTLWGEQFKSKFIEKIDTSDIQISTYYFIPGRYPEYYQALIEDKIRELFLDWGYYSDE